MSMLFVTYSYAQREVTGTVIDEAGIPVEGASVTLVGTNKGTSTNGSGQFSINVPTNGSLTITSVGRKDQTVNVGSRSTVTVVMPSSSASSIQEVIVTTTLGQVRQKSSLGTATSEVKAKELTQGRSTNIVQGLTAKVSGASIQQTSSGVQQNTRIVLRGIRSLTGNNQPMLILDGVPISLNFFSSINPNDIEDINILKSATSTAVYGPDGVNGAIVVTTKRGSNLKPSVSISHSTQFETINYMPEFQNRWGQGYDQDPATGQGTYTPYEQQSWGDEFDGSIRDFGEADPNGFLRQQKYSYIPGERKRFFNTGVTNQTDVSYSTKELYVSGQNVSIKGTLPGDESSRRSLTFRGEKEYNKFKAIVNVRYTQTELDITTANTTIYYGVTSAPGNVPLTQFADWRNDFFASPNGYYTPYLTNFQFTPYFAKDNNRYNGKTDDIFGNTEFQFKASSWLNFIYRLSLSTSTTNGRSTSGAFTPSPFYLTRPSGPSNKILSAALTDSYGYTNRLTSEVFGNVNKDFGDFNLNGTVGYSFRETRTRDLSIGSANLGQTTFFSIVNRLGEPSVGVDNSLSRLGRVFGRVGVNYKRAVYLEGTASYDRDSRLAPANRDIVNKKIDVFYPSVNTSILLHEIFPSIKGDILNFAKIRGAIAKTGNVNICSLPK